MKSKQQIDKEFNKATDECMRLMIQFLVKKNGLTTEEAVAHIKEEGSKPLQYPLPVK